MTYGKHLIRSKHALPACTVCHSSIIGPTLWLHFVRRFLGGAVILLKTVTLTNPDGRDLIGLKLDRQNPVPCATFQGR